MTWGGDPARYPADPSVHKEKRPWPCTTCLVGRECVKPPSGDARDGSDVRITPEMIDPLPGAGFSVAGFGGGCGVGSDGGGVVGVAEMDLD